MCSPTLGSYEEVKKKLDSFDFIDQYSLAVISPQAIIGFDAELNDHFVQRGPDGSRRSLKANEVLFSSDNSFSPGIEPSHLRLKNGDTLIICDQIFVARPAPSGLKRAIGFGDYSDCLGNVALALPMAMFQAARQPEHLVSQENTGVRPEIWCHPSLGGRVVLIKVRLKPRNKEFTFTVEAARRLKRSFGDVDLRFARRPLGEIPMHLLAGLNMLAVLSYLLWPGLALAVFINASHRYREGKSALTLNGPPATPRQLRVLVWIEIIGPAIIGTGLGFFLANATIGALYGLCKNQFFGLIPADLQYDELADEKMLLPTLAAVALAFAITFIAALIPARAALRRKRG